MTLCMHVGDVHKRATIIYGYSLSTVFQSYMDD